MILFGDHRSIKRSTRLDFVDEFFDVIERDFEKFFAEVDLVQASIVQGGVQG